MTGGGGPLQPLGIEGGSKKSCGPSRAFTAVVKNKRGIKYFILFWGMYCDNPRLFTEP